MARRRRPPHHAARDPAADPAYPSRPATGRDRGRRAARTAGAAAGDGGHARLDDHFALRRPPYGHPRRRPARREFGVARSRTIAHDAVRDDAGDGRERGDRAAGAAGAGLPLGAQARGRGDGGLQQRTPDWRTDRRRAHHAGGGADYRELAACARVVGPRAANHGANLVVDDTGSTEPWKLPRGRNGCPTSIAG